MPFDDLCQSLEQAYDSIEKTNREESITYGSFTLTVSSFNAHTRTHTHIHTHAHAHTHAFTRTHPPNITRALVSSALRRSIMATRADEVSKIFSIIGGEDRLKDDAQTKDIPIFNALVQAYAKVKFLEIS